MYVSFVMNIIWLEPGDPAFIYSSWIQQRWVRKKASPAETCTYHFSVAWCNSFYFWHGVGWADTTVLPLYSTSHASCGVITWSTYRLHLMWSCVCAYVCACVLWVVDLKQIHRYFSNKMSLFGNHTHKNKCNLCVLIVNHTQIQTTKKKECSLRES